MELKGWVTICNVEAANSLDVIICRLGGQTDTRVLSCRRNRRESVAKRMAQRRENTHGIPILAVFGDRALSGINMWKEAMRRRCEKIDRRWGEGRVDVWRLMTLEVGD